MADPADTGFYWCYLLGCNMTESQKLRAEIARVGDTLVHSDWKIRALKAEESLKACRRANVELTARVADTEGALREIGYVFARRVFRNDAEAAEWMTACARAALEAQPNPALCETLPDKIDPWELP